MNLRKMYAILGFCRDNVFFYHRARTACDCLWFSQEKPYNTSSEAYVTLRFCLV